jgi:demethylmenaquinone methyltransferase/2-methoxy-6-polyprenyl-1,4-benzoquinol methylase
MIRGMFNRIAARYDAANRAMSFGRDIAWRRRLAEICAARLGMRGGIVLDLATGTGDVLTAISRRTGEKASLIGVDGAETMLEKARRKFERNGTRAGLVQGDAASLPMKDDSVDCVTVAFGVRNFADLTEGFRSILRVLKPGGSLLVLEFSQPTGLMRSLYLLYLRHIIPLIGGAIAGNWAAYRYLNRSIEKFPSGDDFCAIMTAAGYTNVRAFPLTFGVATLYAGVKG